MEKLYKAVGSIFTMTTLRVATHSWFYGLLLVGADGYIAGIAPSVGYDDDLVITKAIGKWLIEEIVG